MRHHDYQKLALRTAPPYDIRTLSPDTDQVLHGAIGMAAEMHEVHQSLFSETLTLGEGLVPELGDVLWYAAICLHGAGYDLEDVEYLSTTNEVDEPFEELREHTSIILDQAKRLVYYNTPLTHTFVVSMIKILVCVHLLAKEVNVSIEEVMERNITKLKIRFPDKFDEAHAVHRNIHKESKAFE